MPRKIYVVRHAEPFFPEGERVYLGRRLDYPLSETGRMQAEALKETLADADIAHVFSSPMRRCIETAEPVGSQGAEVTVLEDLNELDPGEWEGRTARSVRAECGDRFQRGLCCPPPGGESDESGRTRVKRALGEILETEGNVVIVSHRGLIRILLNYLTEVSGGACPGDGFDIRCGVPIPVTVGDDGMFSVDPRFLIGSAR